MSNWPFYVGATVCAGITACVWRTAIKAYKDNDKQSGTITAILAAILTGATALMFMCDLIAH